VVAKYGVIHPQPQQENRAVVISHPLGVKPVPNVRGEVFGYSSPGVDGRVLDDLADVIVNKLETKRGAVDGERKNQNNRNP
jgi:hypothetical protein